MPGLEPKKLALLRILQILERYSDCDHPLTQEEILNLLEADYGIVIERKAVGRNISLLKEAGIDIESERNGSYLASRTFDDTEIQLLIDSVLASKHIAVKQSKDLIERLCSLSNKYFRRHVKNIHTVGEWDKTEYKNLFYNIGVIDDAIEAGRMVEYDYNKYGTDKKLHKTSFQRISPYQLILHNQRYYLMGYSKHWDGMRFHRVDRITNIRVSDREAIPLRTLKGYENGIDYSRLSTGMPYMYADTPERITFYTNEGIVDQIIDWFGKNVEFRREDDKLVATLRSSPRAMLYWAVQYADCVEIISPEYLRDQVVEYLNSGINNYETKQQ
ncbi:MAG: WYL domain-containing protein [Clostridiales bacterium]|nr:WYL domain-containing protein [Clostridiales bacterium]